MSKIKVLLAEDEDTLAMIIKESLETRDFLISVVNNGNQAFNLFLKQEFDVLVLDIMMPEIDGFQLCAKIRTQVDSPILFLTARSDEADIIRGLGLGADDYLTKPFGVQELRARVDAHIRREEREKTNYINIGDVKLLLSSKECFVLDNRVSLTKSEYEISEYLALNRGQVFSKEQIFESVFGFERESNLSIIAEHIKNIRAKFIQFGIEPIKTVWGVGYKWD